MYSFGHIFYVDTHFSFGYALCMAFGDSFFNCVYIYMPPFSYGYTLLICVYILRGTIFFWVYQFHVGIHFMCAYILLLVYIFPCRYIHNLHLGILFSFRYNNLGRLSTFIHITVLVNN